MAKNNVTQYDTTAANNTDVGGISIAEGMSPSNVNNAMRELMKHTADWVSGSQAITKLTTTGDIELGHASDTTISRSSAGTVTIEGAEIRTGTVAIASGGTGSTSASAARSALGVDAAGTDNSTDVTLAGSLDYLTISGQAITRNSIDLTTDVTGALPIANGGTGATTAAAAASAIGVGTEDSPTFSGLTTTGDVEVTGAMDADNFKVNGAQGSDGQVLTSTGSGVAWEAAASGSRTLLETVNISNDATVLVGDPASGAHIDSTYHLYEIEFIDVVCATNYANLRGKFATGTGTIQASTYYSTAQSFSSHSAGGRTGWGYASGSYMMLASANQSSADGEGLTGSLYLHWPSETDRYHSITGELWHRVGTGTSTPWLWQRPGGMWFGATTAITGVQFYMSSGNVSSGTIKLYGRS